MGGEGQTLSTGCCRSRCSMRIFWKFQSKQFFSVYGCWGHHCGPSRGSGWASGTFLSRSGFKVELRSCRDVKQLVDYWRKKLSGHKLLLLDSSSGGIAPNTEGLRLHPVGLKDCTRSHLNRCPTASLQEASGMTFKPDNGKKPFWAEWLQWHSLEAPLWFGGRRGGQSGGPCLSLHGAVAENSFISVINADLEEKCPSCTERDTVLQCVTGYQWLSGLFVFLQRVFTVLTEV